MAAGTAAEAAAANDPDAFVALFLAEAGEAKGVIDEEPVATADEERLQRILDLDENAPPEGLDPDKWREYVRFMERKRGERGDA